MPRAYLIVTVTGEKLRQHKIKRWKNTFVALTHSVITSGLVLFLIANQPEILNQLSTSGDNELVYYVNCFVFGYFIYDTLDSLSMYKTQVFYETMLHHFVVLSVYSIVFFIKNYVACVTVFSLFEVNKIFLNIRQILSFYDYDKKEFLYQINSVVNILTLVVFRLGTLAWVLNWFSESFAQMHMMLALICMFSLFIFSFLSVVLFVRVLKSDLRSDKDLLPLTQKVE